MHVPVLPFLWSKKKKKSSNCKTIFYVIPSRCKFSTSNLGCFLVHLDHLIMFCMCECVCVCVCTCARVLIPKWSLAWKLIHPHSHYLSMGALSQVMNFNFPVPSKGWQTYQSHSIQNDITSHISSHLIFCQLKATDSLRKENWSDKHAFHSKGTNHKCTQGGKNK